MYQTSLFKDTKKETELFWSKLELDIQAKKEESWMLAIVFNTFS